MATEMAQREQLRSLRNDPGLARFVVEGRATGKQLGSGSYGSVEEVTIEYSACREFIILCGNTSESNHPIFSVQLDLKGS